MMIDTHCHLYTKEFNDDIDVVMQNAILAGVSKCYLPAIDSDSIDSMIKLANKYPKNCFLMAGLHPCSVKENYMEEIAQVKLMLQQHTIYGIGETGLDFYWDKTFVKQQYEALEVQIQIALEYNLPLILHTRDALHETIEVIKKYKHTALRGIFHCFGGSLEQAKDIIKTGFYMGIGGIVTYKNAGVAEVLKQVDMQHLVLETDAPYLTPVPFRGKRNESSYLKYVVEKLAEVKNISVPEVENITTANAEKIFGV
jgi:TatD DNase family protein